MANYELEVPISKKNDALVKDRSKCIQCGYCKKICKNDITVARMFEIAPRREPVCINCGQCANICPTESIHERWHYLKVKKLLHNKNDEIVVFSIAPAVRVTLGEEFNLPIGTNVSGEVVTALKKIGVDYVFDITFGADLTVMEEATELVERIKNNSRLPQFSSCCPAWVKYAEIFYPELINNLSTTKSPITMQSTIIKTYFAKKLKVNPDKIINIVVAPCTAKKSEINRIELNVTNKDTNYVLTTRELAKLLKEEDIDLCGLEKTDYDSPMTTGSGAGVIFGSSGGVTEATIRTVYYLLTGKNLSSKKLCFNEIRGMNGIKETSIKINDRVIKFAICNGMKNAKSLIDKLLKKEVNYDFIEVMNCFGGCISGGGNPKITLLEMGNTKEKRMEALYKIDDGMKVRLAHENTDIIKIYGDFLKEPNSKMAKKMLHTKHYDRSYLLRGEHHE